MNKQAAPCVDVDTLAKLALKESYIAYGADWVPLPWESLSPLQQTMYRRVAQTVAIAVLEAVRKNIRVVVEYPYGEDAVPVGISVKCVVPTLPFEEEDA